MKKLVIKLAISSVFLFLVFRQVDVDSTARILRQANPIYFLIMVILIIINYGVSTLRWRELYQGAEKPSLSYFLKLYFKGSFFNNFLPTSIGGDSYKVFKLGKKTKDTVNAFTATFMDRFTGFVLLVLISYVGVVFTWQDWLSLIIGIVGNRGLAYLIMFLGLVGFWIATFIFFAFLKLFAPKVVLVQKLYDALKTYKTSRNLLTSALITSFLVQMCAVLTQYYALLAVGAAPSFLYALAVIPIITLAGFFIPSINGVGVQDFLYMNLFALVGIANPISLSASLVYHFFRLIVSLIGGVFYALDKE
jgi:uncharacterized protein (TIRG00374 family)